jgi:two-component system, NtrC family, sensor kinase
MSLPQRRAPSLKVELTVVLAALLVAGVFVAVVCVLALLPPAAGATRAIRWPLAALLAADIGVFLLIGTYAIDRLVRAPLSEITAVGEAIVRGNFGRRAQVGETKELRSLAIAVNGMTDRLLAEQTQRLRNEKLASIGRLAAGIAHEIGNPLGAINGYTYILSSRVGHTTEGREAVVGLERESMRIDRIVRGLLDYARPRLSTPTPIDINETIRSATAILTAQGALRNVTVHEELDESGPTLFGERHQLEQAFVNLLINAADAMPGGGHVVVRTERYPRAALEDAVVRRTGDPSLKVVPRSPHPRVRMWLERVHPPAEVVNVIVADAGPGIPQGDWDKVFEPFFTTKQPGKGTGLGLAIVASIVESFSGTIWVDRAREGGAAFHMLFPVAVGSSVPVRRHANNGAKAITR